MGVNKTPDCLKQPQFRELVLAATNRDKLLTSAHRALERGNFTRAIKHFSKALDMAPNDVRVRLRIGDLQARLGKKKEAISTYEQVSQEYFYQGFYLKAIAVLKQILRLDATRVDVQLQLADIYRQLNLGSDAISQYRLVSRSYRELGEFDKYVEVLSRIIELEPDDVETYINMGDFLDELGRHQEAGDCFAKASDILFERGQTSDFIRITERYLTSNFSDLDRLKRLVRIYLDQESSKKALRKLQVLFQQESEDVDGLNMLAEAFLGLNEPQKAIKVFKELAEIHSKNNLEELAIETFERILLLDPDNKETKKKLGQAVGNADTALTSKPEINKPEISKPEISKPEISKPEPDEESSRGNTLLPQAADQVAAEQARLATGVIPQVPDTATAFSGWDPDDSPTMINRMSNGLVTCTIDLGDDTAEKVEALISAVDAFLKVGLQDQAIESLDKAMKLDPLNVTSRERAVKMAEERNEKVQAVTHLIELTKLVWNADPIRAISYIEKALVHEPHHTEARLLQSELLEDEGPEVSLLSHQGLEDLEEAQSLLDNTSSLDIQADRSPVIAEPSQRTDAPDDSHLSDSQSMVEALLMESPDETGDEDRPEQDDMESFEDDSLDDLFLGPSEGENPVELFSELEGTDESTVDASGLDEFKDSTEDAIDLKLPELPDGLPEDLVEELEELEFYASMQLMEEAHDILQDIKASFPEHKALVMDRMRIIRSNVND